MNRRGRYSRRKDYFPAAMWQVNLVKSLAAANAAGLKVKDFQVVAQSDRWQITVNIDPAAPQLGPIAKTVPAARGLLRYRQNGQDVATA